MVKANLQPSQPSQPYVSVEIRCKKRMVVSNIQQTKVDSLEAIHLIVKMTITVHQRLNVKMMMMMMMMMAVLMMS